MCLPKVEVVNEIYSVQRFDLNGSKFVYFCPSLSDAQEIADYFNKGYSEKEFFVCPVSYKVVIFSKSKNSP